MNRTRRCNGRVSLMPSDETNDHHAYPSKRVVCPRISQDSWFGIRVISTPNCGWKYAWLAAGARHEYQTTKGIIGGGGVKYNRFKVLGDGEVTRAMTVKAQKFSKSAVQKIEAAGGRIERLETGD